MKKIALSTFILLSIYGCLRELPCIDTNLQMIFTGFNPSDLDTIVLRKFKRVDSFHHLIDTTTIVYNSTMYTTSNDTTKVYMYELAKGINALYDWQIHLPAINKIISISDIVSEQITTQCSPHS